MINETKELIVNNIETLAAKAGQTAEHFWPEYVKAELASAIADCILSVIVTLILVALIRKSIPYFKEQVEDGHPVTVLLIFGYITSTVVCIGTCCSIIYAVTAIVSPEGYAIQQLLKAAAG